MQEFLRQEAFRWASERGENLPEHEEYNGQKNRPVLMWGSIRLSKSRIPTGQEGKVIKQSYMEGPTSLLKFQVIKLYESHILVSKNRCILQFACTILHYFCVYCIFKR